MRSPPRANKPHTRTFPDGLEGKWCRLCGAWGAHYCANHPADEETKEDAETAGGEGHVALEDISELDDSPPLSGDLARLHAVGII